MPNILLNLFDDGLKQRHDLVTSPPQSLETMSSKTEEQDFFVRKVREFDQVVPKVDFSDFENFVFFNSALDYFNITGELILNSFPYDGSLGDVQAFLSQTDDYQRFVIERAWPQHSGHLSFNPSVSSSFIVVEDQGQEDGIFRGALLSPGSSSFSVELWCVPPPVLTGSDDVMVALQKSSGSSGYSVFFSGSSVFFNVSSGSDQASVSVPSVPGQVSYFSFVHDRDASLVSSMTGSSTEFPVAVSSASSPISGDIVLGSVPFYMASGSLTGKVVRPLTGSLDDVRVWKTALGLSDVTSSFNSKVFAQSGLVALWRFNETNATSSLYPPSGAASVVLDYSGHRLNGRVSNYFGSLRASGSLVPFEAPDLVLAFNSPPVQSYIAEQQSSGSSFDRNNDNSIVELLPDKFFELEEETNTRVLEEFLYLIARQFDTIKVRIDQFVHILKTNYTDFNQTPDALLSDIGRFFGWDFTGNFLNADAFQYIVGKGILGNIESNRELDVKLFEIKNEFWRRTLNNLVHIYKSKGTRESVEALLRVYGVNQNFVRLKEYGFKKEVGISTFRIFGEKSVPALMLGSGSTAEYVVSEPFSGSALSIETRVQFPTTDTVEMPATLLTGSVWTVLSSSSPHPMLYQLTFSRQGIGSTTGSLSVSSSAGTLTVSDVSVFDNRWYDVAFVRNTSSLSLDVRSIDDGEVDRHMSSSISAVTPSGTRGLVFWLGATGTLGSELWVQEARVWDRRLDDVELEDHALNFQSYGTTEVGADAQLDLHWRLAEGVTSSAGGTLVSRIFDTSGHGVSGSGYGFLPSVQVYRKFLNEYNFIAPPDYGWNEDRIRVLNSSVVRPEDAFTDNRSVSLEFNLIDALNEDISQMLATLDGFDNLLGFPANRYRGTYEGIESIRKRYFKRLQGRVNFRAFADMLEFFDNSFIEMVRRLIPARALFLGDEFVVESHMLERPKLQWNYRRAPAKFEPEGVITVILRS